MWYRIFSVTPEEVGPAVIAEHLHAHGRKVEPHFKGDEFGWISGELKLPAGGIVRLDRYLTEEDGIRSELNAFAAEIEDLEESQRSARLMEIVIGTKQLVAISKEEDTGAEVDQTCEETARFLTKQSQGVLFIEDRGWFGPDGEELIRIES